MLNSFSINPLLQNKSVKSPYTIPLGQARSGLQGFSGVPSVQDVYNPGNNFNPFNMDNVYTPQSRFFSPGAQMSFVGNQKQANVFKNAKTTTLADLLKRYKPLKTPTMPIFNPNQNYRPNLLSL